MTYQQWLLLAELLDTFQNVALKLDDLPRNDAQKVPINAIQREILLFIKDFKNKLAVQVDQDTVFNTVIPLIFFLDEWLIKHYFQGRIGQWPLLQQRVYKTANGGRLFYRSLDKSLVHGKQHRFVYETYYFLLKDGFCGMHFDKPSTRKHYLTKLEAILCL